MCPKEVNEETIKILKENQGKQIEDSHEDSKHFGFDPDDLQKEHTSYKAEVRLLNKKLDEKKKLLAKDKAAELASIDGDNLSSNPEYQKVLDKYPGRRSRLLSRCTHRSGRTRFS